MSPTSSIIPILRRVTVQGAAGPREIAVRPFRVFQDLPEILRWLPQLAPIFGGNLLLGLIQSGEAGLALTALACRLPPEELLALEGDDQAALLAAMLEVNADFFAQRLIPMMTLILEKLAAQQEATKPKARVFQDMSAPLQTPEPPPDMPDPPPLSPNTITGQTPPIGSSDMVTHGPIFSSTPLPRSEVFSQPPSVATASTC